MQNFTFSRARQSSGVRSIRSNAIASTFLSVGHLSQWSPVYDGVQAKPSGACTSMCAVW